VGWRLALVLGVCLLLLVTYREQPIFERARAVTQDVVSVLYAAAASPASALRSVGDFFQTHRVLREENSRLEQENFILRGQTQRLAAVLAENSRYRDMLNSAGSLEREVMVAEIISVTADASRHILLLDKGSRDGVVVGQPLLGAEGLIGQIITVGASTSRGIMMTDSTHAVPVQVLRSGVRGLAEGTGEIDNLIVRHIAATTDIRVGDILVTSGLGGLFPPGYPVAEVVSIEDDEGSAFATVMSKPMVELDRGRHVMLALGVADISRTAEAL
jgi:rod shape-determining protein MreC